MLGLRCTLNMEIVRYINANIIKSKQTNRVSIDVLIIFIQDVLCNYSGKSSLGMP